jgi:hypothetical protein
MSGGNVEIIGISENYGVKSVNFVSVSHSYLLDHGLLQQVMLCLNEMRLSYLEIRQINNLTKVCSSWRKWEVKYFD